MLIIEGTDLIGKTTLCHKLVDKLNDIGLPYTYQHLSRLPDSWDFYWSYLGKFTRYAVADRFYDSELAYSYARGDGTSLDRITYKLLQHKLCSMGIYKVVIVCTDTSMLKERYTEDEMYDFDVIEKANDWFENHTVLFDEILTVSRSTPFPTDLMANTIIENYLELRDGYANIQRRQIAWSPM